MLKQKLFLIILFYVQVFWTNELKAQDATKKENPNYQSNLEYLLPKLATDEDKLSFLVEVKKQIPALFSDAARYDIDLFTLLENQQELANKLQKIPEYKKLLREKKFFDLTITPQASGIKVGSSHILPSAIESWKNSLILIINGIDGNGVKSESSHPRELSFGIKTLLSEAEEKQVKEIPRILGEIGKLDKMNATEEQRAAQALLNSCLSSKEGGQIHKLKCLRENFSSLSVLPGIKDKNLRPEILEEFIYVVEKYEKREQSAYLLATLASSEGDLPESWKEAINRINSLNQNDIEFLLDKNDALIPLLLKLGFNSDLSEKFATKTVKTIEKVAQQTERKQKTVRTPIRIKQVLPHVGIFRGCTGGDCSSQYSFPYPNDPREMVFFVEDQPTESAKGKGTKGYVSATVVDIGERQRGLYIITISGNRINAGDTELILRGLEKEKEKLGVDEILLPEESQLEGLYNFMEIREVVRSHTKGKKKKNIRYFDDGGIRKSLEEYSPGSGFNEGNYDHREFNKHGVSLKLKTQEVKTNLIVDSEISFDPLPIDNISNEILLEFMADLNNSSRYDTLNRILNIPKVAAKFIVSGENLNLGKEFFEMIKNCRDKDGGRLSVNTLKEKINRIMGLLGIHTEKFLNDHPMTLYPGAIFCSDSLSEENITLTTELMIKDMKKANFSNGEALLSKFSHEELQKIGNSLTLKKVQNSMIEILVTPSDDLDVLDQKKDILKVFTFLPPKDTSIQIKFLESYPELAKSKATLQKLFYQVFRKLIINGNEVSLFMLENLKSRKEEKINVAKNYFAQSYPSPEGFYREIFDLTKGQPPYIDYLTAFAIMEHLPHKDDDVDNEILDRLGIDDPSFSVNQYSLWYFLGLRAKNNPAILEKMMDKFIGLNKNSTELRAIFSIIQENKIKRPDVYQKLKQYTQSSYGQTSNESLRTLLELYPQDEEVIKILMEKISTANGSYEFISMAREFRINHPLFIKKMIDLISWGAVDMVAILVDIINEQGVLEVSSIDHLVRKKNDNDYYVLELNELIMQLIPSIRQEIGMRESIICSDPLLDK